VKGRYRVKVGLNYPTDPAIDKRLRAGEEIPWEERGLRRVEPGDVVDDLPALSIPWLLRDGLIEDATEEVRHREVR